MNSKILDHILAKTRKHTNFNYRLAVRRNKNNQVKTSPLINLIRDLKATNISEANLDQIVIEYWQHVEKNPKFEKEIADKLKIKYIKS